MTEQVMVVHRADIEGHLIEFGMITEETAAMLSIIEAKHFFIDRPTAEVSPQFKQVIPYVVINHGDDYFLLRRTTKQTEARLHHKLSLGIGGHINPGHTLMEGLRKELEEEVHVADAYELEFAGLLNDDTTDVGRVHLGAVYELRASSREVTVRETEKMIGVWTARQALQPLRESMESWSQIVFDALIKK